MNSAGSFQQLNPYELSTGFKGLNLSLITENIFSYPYTDCVANTASINSIRESIPNKRI